MWEWYQTKAGILGGIKSQDSYRYPRILLPRPAWYWGTVLGSYHKCKVDITLNTE
jgi:hypothetical protein